MIRPLHLLPDLIGKICKLRPEACKYETGYSECTISQLLWFQNEHYSKIFFRFVNEQPHYEANTYFYCIEDSELKDWYWFPLNALTICTD